MGSGLRKTSVSAWSKFKVRCLDYLFKQSMGRLPYYKEYSPDIELLENSDNLIKELLKTELEMLRASGVQAPAFLDVGARDATKATLAKGFEYRGVDINPRSSDVIFADICRCPQIESNRFDVVFSLDVFEHLERPWEAAKECVRITKPGGLLIHRTLFAYRYHPVPKDYWRFTAQGLEFLFANEGQAATLLKGYDLRARRRDQRGYNLLSKPPVDWLGGFRENWQVLWVGRKNI